MMKIPSIDSILETDRLSLEDTRAFFEEIRAEVRGARKSGIDALWSFRAPLAFFIASLRTGHLIVEGQETTPLATQLTPRHLRRRPTTWFFPANTAGVRDVIAAYDAAVSTTQRVRKWRFWIRCRRWFEFHRQLRRFQTSVIAQHHEREDQCSANIDD